MKHPFLSKMNKLFFTMLMLAAGAAMLFSCKHNVNTGGGTVTITVTGDANVIVTEPKSKSITVPKSTKWADVKSKISVSFTNNYELFGWKLRDKGGADISDGYAFNNNTTVFAVSKEKSPTPQKPGILETAKITITVKHDDNVTKTEPASLIVAKDSKWSEVKGKITVTFKSNYELSGWKLGDKDGAEIKDDYIFSSDATVFAVSKQKEPVKVTITVKGDDNVDTVKPALLAVVKDSKWSEVKGQITVTCKPGYEFLTWKLNNVNGEEIPDGYALSGDTTVFAVSRKNNERTYTVRDLQQDVSGGEYTKVGTDETKIGEIGKMTETAAKTYTGFENGSFTQQAIKDDNSTVVEIKYNRKMITLNLNWGDGSSVETVSGRFEAPVSITNRDRDGYKFNGWDTSLPKTFALEDDGKTYTARWWRPRIKIQADERFTVETGTLEVGYGKTLAEIRTKLNGKVSLKAEWPSAAYEIYQWRLGGADGKVLDDHYKFDKEEVTLYAVSNYKKFRIGANSELIDYDSEYPPKGTIYIPVNIINISAEALADAEQIENIIIFDNVLSIGEGAFQGCANLKSITLPNTLKTIPNRAFHACERLVTVKIPDQVDSIGAVAFDLCRSLKNINIPPDVTKLQEAVFANCESLESIIIPSGINAIEVAAFNSCSSLKTITVPEKVTVIAGFTFGGCRNAEVILPDGITEIQAKAFGDHVDNYCKKVKVKSDSIKELVIKSGYPADRIERY